MSIQGILHRSILQVDFHHCWYEHVVAPPIENITNDPPPTSQPTDNNPLTDLQDRQRAPQKQLSRCLEDRTRIDLSLSEISDEDVNGQMESNRSLENISSPR